MGDALSQKLGAGPWRAWWKPWPPSLSSCALEVVNKTKIERVVCWLESSSHAVLRYFFSNVFTGPLLVDLL